MTLKILLISKYLGGVRLIPLCQSRLSLAANEEQKVHLYSSVRKSAEHTTAGKKQVRGLGAAAVNNIRTHRNGTPDSIQHMKYCSDIFCGSGRGKSISMPHEYAVLTQLARV